METLDTLLAQSESVALVNAHSDDEIINAKPIAALQDLQPEAAENEVGGALIHSAYLTPGTETTRNNLTGTGFDPALGHRWLESIKCMDAVGYASIIQFFGRDSALAMDVPWLIPQVAEWLCLIKADTVIAPNKMNEDDSDDHATVLAISLAAAELAVTWQGPSEPIHVLAPQPVRTGGEHYMHGNPQSLALVGTIAIANTSQFEAADEPLGDDWEEIAAGRYMNPKDCAVLQDTYDIRGITAYTVRRFGGTALVSSGLKTSASAVR